MRQRLRNAGKLLLVNLAIWMVLEFASALVLLALEPPAADKGDPTDWLNQARMSFEGGLYVWDEHCLWRLAPGYQAGESPGRKFWGDRPLSLNEHGMRSPSVTKEKPAGVRRILVLGGSHPMGMYVDYEDSYAARIEAALNARGAGRWQVLNASAPGHTSFQGRHYLMHYGLSFQPDIVIFDLGVNDTLGLSKEFPLPDHQVNRPPWWAYKTRSVLGASRVYRLLRRLLAPPLDEAVAAQRVPAAQHAENVTAVLEAGRSRGIDVLVANQFRVDIHGTRALECIFPEDAHEPVADLCGMWAALGQSAAAYFADPIHANAEGHGLIARAILSRLDELGWTAP